MLTCQLPCKHTPLLILCAGFTVTGLFSYPFHVLFSAFADCDGDTLNGAFVQYTSDEEEHIITLDPHGNMKKGSTYLRTSPSTLQKLHKPSQNLNPKFAVCEVLSASGGIMSTGVRTRGAGGGGQLPPQS